MGCLLCGGSVCPPAPTLSASRQCSCLFRPSLRLTEGAYKTHHLSQPPEEGNRGQKTNLWHHCCSQRSNDEMTVAFSILLCVLFFPTLYINSWDRVFEIRQVSRSPVESMQVGRIRRHPLSQLCQLSSLREVSVLLQLSLLKSARQSQGMGLMNGTDCLQGFEEEHRHHLPQSGSQITAHASSVYRFAESWRLRAALLSSGETDSCFVHLDSNFEGAIPTLVCSP